MSHWLRTSPGLKFPPLSQARELFGRFQGADFVPETQAGGGGGGGGGGASPAAVFRSVSSSASMTVVSKPAGVTSGDLVIVMTYLGAFQDTDTLATASGDGWTKVMIGPNAHGYYHAIFWKILNAVDVANAWNFSGSSDYGSVAVAYSNNGQAFNNLAIKSTTQNAIGMGSITLAGFTPAVDSRGVVAMIQDRDGNYGAQITTPTNFTERLDTNADGTGTFEEAIFDQLSGYAGADVTCSCNNIYAEVGFLMEIT